MHRVVRFSWKGDRDILLAHIPGYNADEVINVFSLPIKTGTTLAELQEMAWAYPTGGFDINRVA